MNKISIKGILLGVLTDVVSSNILGFIGGFIVGFILVTSGVAQENILSQGEYSLQIVSVIVGFIGTFLGGYIGARIAKREEVMHGVIIGVISCFIGYFLTLLTSQIVEGGEIPVFVYVLTIIAGTLGGYVRKIQAAKSTISTT